MSLCLYDGKLSENVGFWSIDKVWKVFTYISYYIYISSVLLGMLIRER